MPTRNPHTINIASAPPPICLPSALIAAVISLARTTPFRMYSKILMISPATRPPRITLVHLIFPMACLLTRKFALLLHLTMGGRKRWWDEVVLNRSHGGLHWLL